MVKNGTNLQRIRRLANGIESNLTPNPSLKNLRLDQSTFFALSKLKHVLSLREEENLSLSETVRVLISDWTMNNTETILASNTTLEDVGLRNLE